ncbi:SH2 domain-containing adapter protein F [Anolis carolinensis]|uniref:SH2 domain-containing adapter protein F n=1 Tax=Anolis carolinensis TaxID=28377 RepID=UPI002F2B5AF1
MGGIGRKRGLPPLPSSWAWAGSMARWLRDRLLFRKPPPPEPDYKKPDPEDEEEETKGSQPDLVAAYRLQRERDFEDPYAAEGKGDKGAALPPQPPPRPDLPAASEGRRCRSPRRRLIRVEAQAMAASDSFSSRPSDRKMLILEDYADPFDTRQEAGSSPKAEQERAKSEGYMEPYEAQRLLAEIQKKGSNDGLTTSKPLHLYDVPYEPSENGTDPGPLPGTSCRYSWLPEDDERPPEEYDQPWEWKKERISRVFAVEIEGNQELPWPPPVGQLDSNANHSEVEGSLALQNIRTRCQSASTPPNLQNASPSSPDAATTSNPLEADGKAALTNPLPSCIEKTGSPCWSSVEHGLAFGERVNPALPLESQAWYHGTLSRVDAEGLLRLCREASYLVRNSESSHDAFSLSLKSSQGFLHLKLLPTEDNKFVLGQHSPPFDNVPEIIHHYASHKLPIQGAEHMSLLYPVTTQPSSCLAAEQ